MQPTLRHALVLLTVAVLFPACAETGEPKGNPFPFENAGRVEQVPGIEIPNVKHIVDTPRERILQRADILFFYHVSSKFGDILFKHNERWYGAGGFLGGVGEFVRDEVPIKGGVVVFVTDSHVPFNDTQYGPLLAFAIAHTSDPSNWDFYYTEEDSFGDYPEYRDYYDEMDVKIDYPDY